MSEFATRCASGVHRLSIVNERIGDLALIRSRGPVKKVSPSALAATKATWGGFCL
jgi:hypothetical protein